MSNLMDLFVRGYRCSYSGRKEKVTGQTLETE
jgi:hypothetical protein